MEIGKLLKSYKVSQKEKSTITNRRQFVLSQFLEEINRERKFDNWYRYKRVLKREPKLTPDQFKERSEFIKPMTGLGIAMKLCHIKKIFDLDAFLSDCKDYKKRKGSFGKYFFGALKPRTDSVSNLSDNQHFP